MNIKKREFEARGKSTEAAIEAGLAALRVTRDDVEIEVVDEGSRGLLGIGSRDAVVRLTVKQEKPAPAPARPAPVLRSQPEAAPPPAAKPAPTQVPTPAPIAALVDDGDEDDEGGETAVSFRPSPAAQPADTAAPVEADHEEAAVAKETLETLLHKMGVNASVTLALAEPDDLTGQSINVLDVAGEDLRSLIGQRGDTLNALQSISRLIVSHRLQRRANFVIDVEGYRKRRQAALAKMAEHMAQKALKRRRPISLEPMPPHERRIIHMTLREHQGVYTQSVGEGKRRKVQILPK